MIIYLGNEETCNKEIIKRGVIFVEDLVIIAEETYPKKLKIRYTFRKRGITTINYLFLILENLKS